MNTGIHELSERLLVYVRAALRYRWYAVAAAWVVAAAGWTVVSLLPNRYQATARVYVDTQSILKPLLAGLAMQPNDVQVVEMMSRTLISRPNVERVVSMAGMDANLKYSREKEELITRLTRDLTIKSTGGPKNNFYTITYTDKDRALAQRVVESLLTIFVQGSQGDKQKDSDTARSFIDEQLKLYSDRLTAAENAVTAFKRRNVGLMPGQGQNFFERMNTARTELNQARLELAESEQGREAIQKRLAALNAMPPVVSAPAPVAGAAPPPRPTLAEPATPEIDARIQALQQRLDGLRLSYTEQHPDIVAAVAQLAQLKDQKRREIEDKQRVLEEKQRALEEMQRRAKASSPLMPTPAQNQDPVYQKLAVSMAEYDANVASRRARVAEYERRLGELKAAANAVPQVEAEYTQLTRDYEVTKRNYEQLVARREAAQLTHDMQTTAGMDFRVIDPPRVPPTPEWPNRRLFMSLVLVVALGVGAGLAFLISQFRPTVNSEGQLRELGGFPVFGTVVMAWTDAQLRDERRQRFALAGCLFGLLLTYGALMAMLVSSRLASLGLHIGA